MNLGFNIFAFDQLCEEILKEEKLKNVIVIGMKEFETPELLKVKTERTRLNIVGLGSSWSIKYVLENV